MGWTTLPSGSRAAVRDRIARPSCWPAGWPLCPRCRSRSATYIITGTVAASQRSGEYLSAGDVTGDRIPDLLIGAAGDNQAYLFHGGFDPGAVAGIARVEVGLYGPVADATEPVTMTMPVDWQTTPLANPGGALSALDRHRDCARKMVTIAPTPAHSIAPGIGKNRRASTWGMCGSTTPLHSQPVPAPRWMIRSWSTRQN